MRPTLLTTQDRRAFRATSGLILTPDNRWLIAWSDHGARVFDAAQPGPALWSSEHVVRRLSASSHLIAYITRGPHRLVILDVTTAPTTRAEVALSAAPRAVAVAGERVVVVGEDGALRLFEVDVAGRVVERVLEGMMCEGEALCASEDGRWAAAVSTLRAGRATQVCWIEVEALRVAQVVKHTRGGITALRFTPDAQRLVAAAGGEVCVWTKPKVTARALLKGVNLPELLDLTDTGRLVVLDPGAAVICVDVTSGQEQWRQPAARVAAAAGDEVVVYEAGRLLRRDARTGALQGACELSGAARVVAVDATRGEAHVATSAGALLRAWPLADDALAPSPQAHGAEVVCAAARGEWLALGTMEGVVTLHALRAPGGAPHVLMPAPSQDRQPCGWLYMDEEALWVAVGGALTRWRLSDREVMARGQAQREPLRAVLALPARGVIAALSQSRQGRGELVIYTMETLEIIHSAPLYESIDRLHLDEDGVTLWLTHPLRAMSLHLESYVLSAPQASSAPAEAVGWRAAQTLDRATNRQTHWLVRGDLEVECAPLVSGPLVWGAHIMTLHQDRALCVWDAETGAQLARHITEVGAPARLCVLEGMCVVCGVDGSAQLWMC